PVEGQAEPASSPLRRVLLSISQRRLWRGPRKTSLPRQVASSRCQLEPAVGKQLRIDRTARPVAPVGAKSRDPRPCQPDEPDGADLLARRKQPPGGGGPRLARGSEAKPRFVRVAVCHGLRPPA